MAEKEPAILKIVNKATGAVWEVPEGSPAHKRCAGQPKVYEILKQSTNSPPEKPPDGKKGGK